MEVKRALSGQLHRARRREIGIFADEMKLINPQNLARRREANRPAVAKFHVLHVSKEVADITDNLQLVRIAQWAFELYITGSWRPLMGSWLFE